MNTKSTDSGFDEAQGRTAAPSGSAFDDAVKMDWQRLWQKVPHDYHGSGSTVKFECDDAGGILRMLIGPDGDVHIGIDEHPRADQVGHYGHPSVRIRTYQGGGHSQRVRNAALLLMLAIVEDTESDTLNVSDQARASA